MQEQRFKEAKKAVVTPLMNHMATPSNFPQAEEEPWVEETLLESTEFGDRRLKKPLWFLCLSQYIFFSNGGRKCS